MINLLIRTIELAVSTPFRAFATIRAIPRPTGLTAFR